MKLEETEAYIQESAKIKARSDAFKKMVLAITKVIAILSVVVAVLIGGYVGYIKYQDREEKEQAIEKQQEKSIEEQKELSNMLTQEDKSNSWSGKKMMTDRDNAVITLHPLDDHTLIIELDWMGGLALFEDLYIDSTEDKEVFASKGSNVISKIKIDHVDISGKKVMYAIDIDNVRYKSKIKSIAEVINSEKWRSGTPQEREQWRNEYNQMATALGKAKM